MPQPAATEDSRGKNENPFDAVFFVDARFFFVDGLFRGRNPLFRHHGPRGTGRPRSKAESQAYRTVLVSSKTAMSKSTTSRTISPLWSPRASFRPQNQPCTHSPEYRFWHLKVLCACAEEEEEGAVGPSLLGSGPEADCAHVLAVLARGGKLVEPGGARVEATLFLFL